MSQNLNRWLTLIGVVGIVIALDQITKRWILDNILLGELRQPIPALQDYFRLTYSENTGFAFGLGQGGGNIIMVIAIVVVIAMIYYYPRIQPEFWLTRIAMGMLMGGALGNVIDRLEYGFVVDFINYRIPGIISNVSNIADHAVVLGVLLILLDSWRIEKRMERAQQAGESELEMQPESQITKPESNPDI